MRRTMHPAISASLIHEVRMVAETFFATRSLTRGSKKKSSLKCAICLRLRTVKVEEAVTIDNGKALCHLHLLAS